MTGGPSHGRHNPPPSAFDHPHRPRTLRPFRVANIEPEISRFSRKELPHMPGSPTTPGWPGTRDDAPVHVAFRDHDDVGTRNFQAFAAQWLACVLPCRRFADTLAGADARLGANADRYSFTVVDLHRLLLAGFDRRTASLELQIRSASAFRYLHRSTVFYAIRMRPSSEIRKPLIS